MFFISTARLTRPATRLHIPNAAAVRRPVSAAAIRFNSSQSKTQSPDKQAKKEALERFDDLQRDWDARILTYDELKPKTQSPTPNMYLIDVRERDEVIQGMIPSAVNLPLSVLGESLHLSQEDFKARHGFEKPKQDQEVIFYCRSGMRSSTASDVAKRNGYTNISNYKGSWLDWVNKSA
ncbi:hypothetical protein AX15_005673 [Amanita polypyramis BW_CC]|nr:hypothetical protein AX15_005673 [Amanita polypyramis BW_CC]